MQISPKFNGPKRDTLPYPFGFFMEAEADAPTDEQSVAACLEARRALVQKANAISSKKVACGFLYHPADVLVGSTSVIVPEDARTHELHELDCISLA